LGEGDTKKGQGFGLDKRFYYYNDSLLKNSDLSTAHRQTVGPLPFHGIIAYPYGPDEVYPEDADLENYHQEYNTREITTEEFRRSLFDKKNEKNSKN